MAEIDICNINENGHLIEESLVTLNYTLEGHLFDEVSKILKENEVHKNMLMFNHL